jgi:hypothetical protein
MKDVMLEFTFGHLLSILILLPESIRLVVVFPWNNINSIFKKVLF